MLVLPRDCSDQFAFPVSAIGSLFPLHSPAERTSAGSAPNAKQFCEIEVGAFFNSHRNFSTVIHWQKKTAHRPIFLGPTKVPENSTAPGRLLAGNLRRISSQDFFTTIVVESYPIGVSQRYSTKPVRRRTHVQSILPASVIPSQTSVPNETYCCSNQR